MTKSLISAVAAMLLFACNPSPQSDVAAFSLHFNQVAIDASADKSAVIAFDHAIGTDELAVDLVKVDSPAAVVYKAKVSDLGKFTEWQKANQRQFYLLADFNGALRASSVIRDLET